MGAYITSTIISNSPFILRQTVKLQISISWSRMARWQKAISPIHSMHNIHLTSPAWARPQLVYAKLITGARRWNVALWRHWDVGVEWPARRKTESRPRIQSIYWPPANLYSLSSTKYMHDVGSPILAESHSQLQYKGGLLKYIKEIYEFKMRDGGIHNSTLSTKEFKLLLEQFSEENLDDIFSYYCKNFWGSTSRSSVVKSTAI